jgi:hypothetical protein
VTEQPAAIGIMFDIEEVPELGPALVVKQVRRIPTDHQPCGIC